MVRPFKGLGQTVGPDDRYDVVIVGSGIGGLITANLLVREGLKVLMLEQHYQVGGYCSTFRRKRFTFDAATHFYPLLGNPSSLTGGLLKELGMKGGWVKMDPVDTFHFPDQSQFEVPADFDTYLARVKAEFPHEADNLDDFFALVQQAHMHGLLHYFRERTTKKLISLKGLTMTDVLDRFIKDRKLKLLLCADCPHWGSAPKNTSFVFDSMLRLSYFQGNYYPVGGSQAFSDELAASFEQLGGHILMKAHAEQILVEHGSAVGVAVRTGPSHRRVLRKVKATTVVSNADMLVTLNRLVEPSLLDPAFVAGVRSLRPSFPCFLMHLGVHNISTEELERVQGYYWNEWDPDLVGRNGLKLKIFVPTLYEPRMAPPGQHVILIQKVQEIDFDSVTDWKAHKAAVERYLMGELERIIPGISSKILVSSSASAFTSYRFTHNHHGAMLGWAMSPDQLGVDRPDINCSIDNLFFTGHWTRPGGGITPVIISAMRAARAVTQGAPVSMAV